MIFSLNPKLFFQIPVQNILNVCDHKQFMLPASHVQCEKLLEVTNTAVNSLLQRESLKKMSQFIHYLFREFCFLCLLAEIPVVANNFKISHLNPVLFKAGFEF